MHRGRGVSNSSGPSLSDQIRVLVVGDSGVRATRRIGIGCLGHRLIFVQCVRMQVGKTVLSHLVCKGEVLPNSSYTVGCSTEVKVPPLLPLSLFPQPHSQRVWCPLRVRWCVRVRVRVRWLGSDS
jgi:hypothetical protein